MKPLSLLLKLLLAAYLQQVKAKKYRIDEMIEINKIAPHDFINHTLLKMYGKYGLLYEAESFFQHIQQPDILTYNTMMKTYIRNGHSNRAVQLFHQIQQKGLTPDENTFNLALTACGKISSPTQGQQILEMMKMKNIPVQTHLNSAIIIMYGKCGLVDEAKAFFQTIQRTLNTYTAMMAVYTKNGHLKEAQELFYQMEKEGIRPDEIAFKEALSAFGGGGDGDGDGDGDRAQELTE